MFAFYCYRHILDNESKCALTGDKFGTTSYGYAFRYAKYAVVCAAVKNFNEHWKIDDLNKKAKNEVAQVLKKWKDFESFATSNPNNSDYFSADTDYDGYYKGKTVNADIAAFDFK